MKKYIKEILYWVIIGAAGMLLGYCINTFLIVNATVPSGSMENTIMTGDHIYGNRFAYTKSDPQRYDIVIFYFPDDEKQIFIKRVIGLPGETVNIIDGKVYINDSDTPLRDDFIREPMLGSFGPFQVPEGHYFMLGDNRNTSMDSRFWKNPYVAKDKILGKGIFCYWPLSDIGTFK